MLFPIGDDNRDRTITPVVNYFAHRRECLGFCFPSGIGNE